MQCVAVQRAVQRGCAACCALCLATIRRLVVLGPLGLLVAGLSAGPRPRPLGLVKPERTVPWTQAVPLLVPSITSGSLELITNDGYGQAGSTDRKILGENVESMSAAGPCRLWQKPCCIELH